MENYIEVTETHFHQFGALLSITVFDESETESPCIPWRELFQARIDLCAGLCDFWSSIRLWWWGGHGAFDGFFDG